MLNLFSDGIFRENVDDPDVVYFLQGRVVSVCCSETSFILVEDTVLASIHKHPINIPELKETKRQQFTRAAHNGVTSHWMDPTAQYRYLE